VTRWAGAIVETRGNDDCHVILRGGKAPNYDAAHVAQCCAALRAAGLREQVMIDVSLGNSGKSYLRQIEVARDVAAQVAGGDARIFGVMVESTSSRRHRSSAPARTTQQDSPTARASPMPAWAGTIARCSGAGDAVQRGAPSLAGRGGSAAVALQPRAAPIDVVAAQAVEVGAVQHASQHEQQVAQAVEVLARRIAHRPDAAERRESARRRAIVRDMRDAAARAAAG
jgi:hypothetical protein